MFHFFPTAGIPTFRDYARKAFLPFLRNQLNSAKRLDMVWDTHKKNSIKEIMRGKRGKGVRRSVEAQKKIPGKWQDFLHDPDNKKELFASLQMRSSALCFPLTKKSSSRPVMHPCAEDQTIRYLTMTMRRLTPERAIICKMP